MGLDTHSSRTVRGEEISPATRRRKIASTRAAAWPARVSGPTHRAVKLLGIGAGPSKLALAVALEELAPDSLAAASLLIEQHKSVAWQRGMLLPWAQSQVSFLKDLVTLRNPRSGFSFLAYLRAVDRLERERDRIGGQPHRTVLGKRSSKRESVR